MSVYDTLNDKQKEAVYIRKDRFLYWREPVRERHAC